MKKWMLVVFLLILIIAFFISYSDAYWLFNGRRTDGNMYYCLHDNKKICYVSHIDWIDAEDTVEIYIKDELDGHRVISFGGYHVLDPFLANVEGTDLVTNPEGLPENAVIHYKHLIINIGKNIERIGPIEMKSLHRDAKTGAYYQILVTINCAEENEFFYSEDGKLFWKRTGFLVDEFYYDSDFVSK